VKVPDLVPVYPKLPPPEPMRPLLDPGPSCYFVSDNLPKPRHLYLPLA
jgi:hypothetical protein